MDLTSFIDSVKTFLGAIGDFLSYLLSLPLLLVDWFNSFPPFISNLLLSFVILLTAILVIKVIILIKGVIL